MGKLLGKSWADSETLTVTSESGGYVKENLQDLQPGRVWRSTSTADQTIQCPFSTPRECTGFCLYGHNLSNDADITLTIYEDAAYTTVVETTTVKALDPEYGLGEQPLGLLGLGGYSDEGLVRNFTVIWFESTVVGQSMEVVISDSTNVDGYVEVGRMKIGSAVDVPVAPGYSMGFGEQTDITRTRGGALRSENRPTYRYANIDTTLMEREEAAALLTLYEEVGRRGDILWTAFPSENTTREKRNTILGRMTSGGGVTITNEGELASLTIEEGL